MIKFYLIFIIFLFFGNGIVSAGEGIVAIVNNDVITQKELNDTISFIKIQMSAQYSEDEIEKKINEMSSDFINKLIEDRLILQAAYKEGIVINENRLKARVEQIKQGYRSEAEFQDALIARGLSLADIELKIKEQLLMVEIIDRKIRKKIKIIPQEITDYYNTHTEDFNKAEQRKVRCLIIKDQTLVEKIEGKIPEYKNLDTIAKDYSLEITDFDWISAGQLRQEIAGIVFNSEAGKLTTFLDSDGNFYIFEVMSIEPAGKHSLLEVQGLISQMLFEIKMQQALAEWIEGLRSQAYIKIKVENETS